MASESYSGALPGLSPQMLMRAYAAGIFPMSESATDPEVFWVDPERRGVLPLSEFHISRSLRRVIRQARYQPRINEAFARVVECCADRQPTWINQDLVTCYTALHLQGHAHSVEIWDDEGLAGGVFGVALAGAFFGESMFSARPNASKLALAHLVQRLSFGGFTLFDTQFTTDHLRTLGGKEIHRSQYRAALAEALSLEADFLALPADAELTI